jgi:hypothetical protein
MPRYLVVYRDTVERIYTVNADTPEDAYRIRMEAEESGESDEPDEEVIDSDFHGILEQSTGKIVFTMKDAIKWEEDHYDEHSI